MEPGSLAPLVQARDFDNDAFSEDAKVFSRKGGARSR
jgi:hypothetical protein